MSFPSFEDVLGLANALPAPPVAIEVEWDGDTAGWFVILIAVHPDPDRQPPYRSHDLAKMRGADGDLRLFNNQVPPWPEALHAKDIGRRLAACFGAEFYFPSPDYPEDDCPRWWEQAEGAPCQDCGIPLLQRDPCPWRGRCYHCFLRAEGKLAAPAPAQGQ
ncbi:MAG TPA: hypothetical protein VGE07_12860 [Herpetosiphonaceae bacterium]